MTAESFPSGALTAKNASLASEGADLEAGIAPTGQEAPKGLASWKAEFYPIAASACPKEHALAHSLQKWRGLRADALQRHAVYVNFTRDYVKDQITHGRVEISAVSCALCQHYAGDEQGACSECPLTLSRGGRACDERRSDEPFSPWYAWRSSGSTEPMIAALEAAAAVELRGRDASLVTDGDARNAKPSSSNEPNEKDSTMSDAATPAQAVSEGAPSKPVAWRYRFHTDDSLAGKPNVRSWVVTTKMPHANADEIEIEPLYLAATPALVPQHQAPVSEATWADPSIAIKAMDNVDKLLAEGGYSPDSSARHQLAIARSIVAAGREGA